MSSFRVTYEAEDGYVGSRRPLSFNIFEYDLWDDMKDEDIEELFYVAIQEDFEQRVSPASDDLNDFKAWAKERIEESKKST
jgi:hypothetical protein